MLQNIEVSRLEELRILKEQQDTYWGMVEQTAESIISLLRPRVFFWGRIMRMS